MCGNEFLKPQTNLLSDSNSLLVMFKTSTWNANWSKTYSLCHSVPFFHFGDVNICSEDIVNGTWNFNLVNTWLNSSTSVYLTTLTKRNMSNSVSYHYYKVGFLHRSYKSFYVSFDALSQPVMQKVRRPTTTINGPSQNGQCSKTSFSPNPMQHPDLSTSVIKRTDVDSLHSTMG